MLGRWDGGSVGWWVSGSYLPTFLTTYLPNPDFIAGFRAGIDCVHDLGDGEALLAGDERFCVIQDAFDERLRFQMMRVHISARNLGLKGLQRAVLLLNDGQRISR